MNLYNVMLVDDEEDVIQAIIKKVNWEELGFHVIGYARNGEEALEMAEALNPDVVMSDIKMPFMDGLTLCRKLREQYRRIKLIIFSGFDEFEYAKEAIKIEAEEYILKPINSEELKGVFKKIKENLDSEVNEMRNIEKLREYYLQSIPVMQEQFLAGLIEGRIPDSQIEEMNKEYQVGLKAAFYVVTVVYTDMNPVVSETPPIDAKLTRVSLKQLVDEYLQGEYSFRSFIYMGSYVNITMLGEMKDIKNYTDFMNQICKASKRVLGINVTAGIGKVYNHLELMSLSYESAKEAVDYRVLYESNQAIYIGEIEPNVNHRVTDDEGRFALHNHDIENIVREIKFGEKESLFCAIDEFIVKLKSARLTLQQFQVILMELITELLKLGGNYKLSMQDIFGEGRNIYQEIMQFESIDKLKEWMTELCVKIRSFIRKERIDSAKLIIERATQYIEDNYAQSDLSVDSICNYLNVSAAYFSTIFKRETGKTFVIYLTEKRMEEAIKLLNTTEEKTYIISERVGYTEPNYFSYVFKRKYGVSPSKYRNNRVENYDTKD